MTWICIITIATLVAMLVACCGFLVLIIIKSEDD